LNELMLEGLDGKNPIGFLAALGILNAVADRARSAHAEPRLRWRTKGSVRPLLLGPDRGALLELLVEDLASFRTEPAVEGLRYPKNGDGPEAHDLKPRPAFYRAYLRELLASQDRRSLAFAAAFATDVAVDNNGNTKPTALHFTAGQQEFLGMVHVLTKGVTQVDLEEAMFGPWTYARELPILQWDNSSSRDYALRASDPSKDKKTGIPGADWLAFRGLSFFPTVPVADRVATTACKGGWKTGTFRWPLWAVPAARATISALLRSRDLDEVDPIALRERGVEVVLESGIRRSDQGGYGCFTPARVARPRPSGRATVASLDLD
jgi:hypothetical protein